MNRHSETHGRSWKCVVPGRVVLDRALDDLRVRADREARPPGGVEAARERGLELRLPRVHVVLDA